MPTSETPTAELIARFDGMLDCPEAAIDFENMSVDCTRDLWRLACRFPAELAAARREGMEECLRIVANWDSSGKSWNDLVTAIHAAALKEKADE